MAPRVWLVAAALFAVAAAPAAACGGVCGEEAARCVETCGTPDAVIDFACEVNEDETVASSVTCVCSGAAFAFPRRFGPPDVLLLGPDGPRGLLLRVPLPSFFIGGDVVREEEPAPRAPAAEQLEYARTAALAEEPTFFGPRDGLVVPEEPISVFDLINQVLGAVTLELEEEERAAMVQQEEQEPEHPPVVPEEEVSYHFINPMCLLFIVAIPMAASATVLLCCLCARRPRSAREDYTVDVIDASVPLIVAYTEEMDESKEDEVTVVTAVKA